MKQNGNRFVRLLRIVDFTLSIIFKIDIIWWFRHIQSQVVQITILKFPWGSPISKKNRHIFHSSFYFKLKFIAFGLRLHTNNIVNAFIIHCLKHSNCLKQNVFYCIFKLILDNQNNNELVIQIMLNSIFEYIFIKISKFWVLHASNCHFILSFI